MYYSRKNINGTMLTLGTVQTDVSGLKPDKDSYNSIANNNNY